MRDFALAHHAGLFRLAASEQASAMAAKNILDHEVLGPFSLRTAPARSDRAAENIAYGSFNATRDEIIQAAKLSESHDFIQRLPEGYDTVVGEALYSATPTLALFPYAAARLPELHDMVFPKYL